MNANDTEALRARYIRIRAAKDGDPTENIPPKTLAEIAKDEGIGKERVRQILNNGMPKANGRPPKDTRRAELEANLAGWQARRDEAVALGKGTTYIDERIATLTERLAR